MKNNHSSRFQPVNDKFYSMIDEKNFTSRFKIYISQLLNQLDWKEDKRKEIDILKKARKNISSVITTNYDSVIEEIFEFSPLVGNDVLLSNPFGSVYKIHGCTSKPNEIIINESDYQKFESKYELIRAQLLSLFIHNPIIFLGYSITDSNIRKILKTVFDYVDLHSEEGKKIQKNFLLVEYDEGSESDIISNFDIDLEGTNIRINKLQTDNFIDVYEAISKLQLPISTMDIRKVQSIVREIYRGSEGEKNSIKVHVDHNIDDSSNGDRVLAIGTIQNVKYTHKKSADFISDYFRIVVEDDQAYIGILPEVPIQSNEWFPYYKFSELCPDIESLSIGKDKQKAKIEEFLKTISVFCESKAIENQKFIYNNMNGIMDDQSIARSNKAKIAFYTIMNNPNFDLDSLKKYLMDCKLRSETDYRKFLCLYDYKSNISP